ncbi:class I SAM-dependent DNA methyltransferase [Flexivirga lutea]
MTNPLIERAEQHEYQRLFIQDLNWSAPDREPIVCEIDGRHVTATNVSQYKGLRVWAVNEKPDSKIEAALDQLIAKTNTDRIVIFYDGADQVWRWPVRRVAGNATLTRLSRHKHRAGDTDPRFADKLDIIRLPFDVSLDSNAVLAKVRQAFDVEAHNEAKYASKLMARLYTAMETAYADTVEVKTRDHQISVTLARILFLMFADDTAMWLGERPDVFQDYIRDHTKKDGSDIGVCLGELFAYLDTSDDKRADVPEEFDGFKYVNGGLFREPIELPKLNAEFRRAILDAGDRDWATISPAIFGSMFQSVRDPQTRRELGEHYTSETNILKTLNPLFLDDLRAEYEAAINRETWKKQENSLKALREKLGAIRFMDPACGCGNFIIVAYRELRDLELAIMERLQVLPSGEQTTQILANEGLKVTLDHFYGIEIDEWPARIAETAMFLIDRQCDLKLTASLGWAPDRLPIQRQATIVVGNALRREWRDVLLPSDNVLVAGNPPFIGQSLRTDEQVDDLKTVWGSGYDGYFDYVTGWFKKAIDFLADTSGARFAFVSTNSIAQGQPVTALFRPIFDAGWRIRFAHQTFAWTSEAAEAASVHCVITGFDKQGTSKPILYGYRTIRGEPTPVQVKNIGPYLVDGPNMFVKKRSTVLAPDLPPVDYGSKPADGKNFTVRIDQYDGVVADPIAAKYLRPYIGAKQLTHGLKRWCLWLQDATPSEIRSSPILAARVEKCRIFRLASEKAATRALAETPHLFAEPRATNGAYLAIPRHVTETRAYFTVARYDDDVICSDANFTAPDPDGVLFAVISSSMFLAWQAAVGGRIKSDYRFANTLVWNTLPLPSMGVQTRKAIIDAGRAVLAARNLYPALSLATLYEPEAIPPELVAAHRSLDELVDTAFGSDRPMRTMEDRQAVLLRRYTEMTADLFTRDVRRRRR